MMGKKEIKYEVQWKNSPYEDNPSSGTYYQSFKRKDKAVRERINLKKKFPKASWSVKRVARSSWSKKRK